MRLLRSSFPLLLPLFFACEEKAPPKPAAPAPKEKPAAPLKEKPAEKPATEERAPAECMSSWSVGAEKSEVKAYGRTFVRSGTMLEEQGAADGKLVLGVIADVKEDTPENLANVDALVAFFQREGAEAIIATGDLGEEQKSIEVVLDHLAAAKLPIFAIVGNRDGRKAFNAALDAAAKRHEGVFNLNQIRLAKLKDAALVSVPGYYNPTYIHPADGCPYAAADVDATKPAVTEAGKLPVIIVSHGPPRQSGANALDRTLEQENVGDPALSAFIKANGVHFGIFANIHEAGGRATDLTGERLVGQGSMADELFLNSGPADGVRWTMNDGTESIGMGAVFLLAGGKADFKVHRIEKKAAQ